MRLRVAGAVALLVLGLGTAGCGESAGGSKPPVVALDTARTRLRELVEGTTGALTPAVRYADDAYRAVPHENAARDNDGTAKLTLRRYVLTKVSAANQPRLLEQVRAYWSGLGYTPHDTGAPDLASATAPDGTGVTVSVGAVGNVTVIADAWVRDPGSTAPFGPAPSPLPTGKDGGPDTVPTFEDPAWS
ncbi:MULTISPECIES: hypothetical protein [Kitasatospora]|uniref:Lipoprotein n=1 Tax=Kitasatospora setae (strain ATCC 33774 / DSM 43861 / JCM 3304 / KCC A-0304 / NBRC 14216 / KM-6054) TaxID=452652 RepID=E4NA99_KITSK|nr:MULTISPECIES: hypothetical protein [Kitasatospora]BAJ28130.1 hypothetical protein KSE_23100 [Kitasatospora setae KM-6054]